MPTRSGEDSKVNTLLMASLLLVELAQATCDCNVAAGVDPTHPAAHRETCTYYRTLETIVSCSNGEISLEDFNELVG